jgi:hypothetical protein
VKFLFFNELDLDCGLKTLPVRCSNNNCQNRGICHVDMIKNISQCVCPAGKFLLLFFVLSQNNLSKDLLVIDVNI